MTPTSNRWPRNDETPRFSRRDLRQRAGLVGRRTDGMMTAFVISMLGTGVGLYLGRTWLTP
jgi:hypothetical protein